MTKKLSFLLILLFFSFGFSNLSKFYVKIDYFQEKTVSDFLICFKNETINYLKMPIYEKYTSFNYSTSGKYIKCYESKNLVECNFELTKEKKCITLLFLSKVDKEKVRENIFILSHSLNIPYKSDEISITAVLPEGAIIANVENPVFPSKYYLSMDPLGRRIVVNWRLNDAGEIDFLTKVYIEMLENKKTDFAQAIYFVLPLIIALAILLYLKLVREKTVISILNENEKKIVELLKKKKKIIQKDLVQYLDLSKAKISRIVKEMEKRGIIEIERRGRNNILKLKVA
ncbi:MAG: winged helix-turn-helix transcriptional regulator [Candidatus Aenigmarchaeota archaeon]|nr:winged helix-turn-helix transcriptional regulator [Candidatus Aenigmarchaeota archaeon]MDW8148975.1 winged helix-turn-helix transcriptional regulator [Candidatus Aenigmarchaeota archaeon]